VYQWIEKKTMTGCSRAVFTTPGAVQMYAERYSELPPERISLIANGYDESAFAKASENGSPLLPRADSQVVLLHSGSLYPNERNPVSFYNAIARLRETSAISPATLQVVLRGTGHVEFHRRLIQDRGIESIVHIEPALPYREALSEMLHADGLVLFQASSCNQQIPAKVYEYLRAGRPILALTDSRGDTGVLLESVRGGSILPLDDEESIVQGLPRFLSEVREGRAPVAAEDVARKHSRRARAAELAALLDEVIGNPPSRGVN
jgi:glycosyltransferase involved in cell wall biosynthesis